MSWLLAMRLATEPLPAWTPVSLEPALRNAVERLATLVHVPYRGQTAEQEDVGRRRYLGADGRADRASAIWR